jgi:hypothetical protein
LAADGGPRRPKRWSGKSGGKNEKLGIVPMDKLASSRRRCGHRKNLAALAPAEEAAATSKAAVLAAMCKALKLPDPDSLTFHADAEKVVVVRRPKEKQTRRATRVA